MTTENVCVRILNEGVLDANGYVNLEVVDWKAGNLIVAAYKGDVILWSWHLWLTEKPVDQGNGIYSLMDRNLGATKRGSEDSVNGDNALAVYGLLYQWGRKDPFPGAPVPKSTSSGADSSVWFKYDGDNWIKKTDIDIADGPITVKAASENPTNFIVPKEKAPADDDKNKRWHWMKGYYESDNHLYCKALWGYTIEDKDTGIKPTKTLYDPCPPGYTVAHHWVFWNDYSQIKKSSNRTALSKFSIEGSFGLTYTVFATGNYFPAAGRRNYNGKYENVGKTCYLWGSTPKSGGRTLEINFDRTEDPTKVSSSNGHAGSDYGKDQAFGQSVRCLKQ